ncbi:uncharacterized protein LOC101236825 [Hydra vulgaris]|uniref:uncharacterized protein LOC101236825 n=1 Tax=Hydra vulgaris TaxID=6087 RepID=UPI001F5E9EEF|nr:uncharacterized protein LOC101236825 [Hydra vulgaris]
MTEKAFDSDGKPIVPSRPLVKRILANDPKRFCGKYMLKEMIGDNFNCDAHYERNKKHAWAVVNSSNIIPVPSEYNGKPENLRSSAATFYTTPISSIWQSECGNFILFPPDDAYTFTTIEKFHIKDWFPRINFKEYLCYPSSSTKFNIRNPTNWKQFMGDCKKILMRRVLSDSEAPSNKSKPSEKQATNTFKKLLVKSGIKAVDRKLPSAINIFDQDAPTSQSRSLKRKFFDEVMSSADKLEPKYKKLAKGNKLAKKNPKDSKKLLEKTELRKQQTIKMKTPPVSAKQKLASVISYKSDKAMKQINLFPKEDDEAGPKLQALVDSISGTHGSQRLCDSDFDSPQPGSIPSSSDIELTNQGQEVLDVVVERNLLPPPSAVASPIIQQETRASRRNIGSAVINYAETKSDSGSDFAQPTSFDFSIPPQQPAILKPIVHNKSIVTAVPKTPSPTRLIVPTRGYTSVPVVAIPRDKEMQDLFSTMSTQNMVTSSQVSNIDLNNTCASVIKYMNENPSGSGILLNLLTTVKDIQVDQKLLKNQFQFLVSTLNRDRRFLTIDGNSDFYFSMASEIQKICQLPLSKIGDLCVAEEMFKNADYVSFLLMIFVTNSVAGGPVGMVAGFVWDKFFTPSLSSLIAWASIDECREDGFKEFGRKDGEKKKLLLFKSRFPRLTQMIYHIIRRRAMLSEKKPPSTFKMNEEIKKARAVSVRRYTTGMCITDFQDSSSAYPGRLCLAMFSEDIDQGPEFNQADFKEDQKVRRNTCFICSNRSAICQNEAEGFAGDKLGRTSRNKSKKYSAAAKKEAKKFVKKNNTVEKTARGSCRRPNRRVNEKPRREFLNYCSFAHRFQRIEERAMNNMSEGVSFLDCPAICNCISRPFLAFFYIFLAICVMLYAIIGQFIILVNN